MSVELMQQGTIAWNKHDGEALCTGYTDESILVHPRGTFKGKAAIRKFNEDVWAAYPDSQVESVTVGDLGNGLIAQQWIMHGTNSGTLLDGAPATGRKVTFPGATFAQYDGDKVVSERVYFDLHDLLKQLNVV
jgi:steroid delta-isomerase-like uncharacterized protein